jgi:hypothetical protein
MASFRTVWAALVAIYEETLVLLAANLLALAVNLPLAVLVLVLAIFVTGNVPDALWWAALGALVALLPTPGNVALAGVTQVAAGPDVPYLRLFTQTLRARWRIASRCTLVSVVVLVALLGNAAFYLYLGPGWPTLVATLWAYAALFWLGLHVYLAPLVVHVAEPRVRHLYRRAALLCLGHGGYTFVLLVLLLVFAFAAVIFVPVYVLLALSFVSVAQALALREIRRRHGDLTVDPRPAEVEEAGGL